MKKFISLFAIGILLSTSLTNCTNIGATEKGFKFHNAGSEKGRVETIPTFGFTMYIPLWTVVVSFPTELQHYVWTSDLSEGAATDEHIEIPCKGGAVMKCNVGFNYTVNPDSVEHIYFMFKTDDLKIITRDYIRLVVRGAMAEISGTLTPDSLFNCLPQFESSVRETLTDTLRKQGFIVQTFSLTHAPIPMDGALIAAISAKNAEKQLADQAIFTRIKNENLAQANIATARGDSAVKVINAQGEAKAINVKQLVLTPQFIEYTKWSLWDGKLPSTVLGSGQSVIYNPK